MVYIRGATLYEERGGVEPALLNYPKRAWDATEVMDRVHWMCSSMAGEYSLVTEKERTKSAASGAIKV